MRKIPFVATLYLLGAIGLFLGGSELFQKVRFDLGAEAAIMKSTDPILARTAKYNPTGGASADVDYETSHGTVPVRGVRLSADEIQKLVRGEGIPLRYNKSNPHWTLRQWDEMPNGIGWLLFGVVASGVAVYAHRLLRREASLG